MSPKQTSKVREAFVSFFEKVYRLVSMIPAGKVASYGQIARMLGSPHGARTVGWALHSLPDGIDVPWHRVINSQGRISTSFPRHGANLQREFLEAEGVVFDEEDRINWEVYGWEGLDWAELDALWGVD
jgi:methylated-DNA-protein-cysteine methyltransferase-like protein